MIGVAVNVTLVPSHMVDPVLLEMLTAVATVGLTVIVMLLLLAEEVVAQLMEVVRSQVTISPLFSEEEVYELLLVPTGDPLTNHWYEGVPPLVVFAVNVTLVPAQIVVAEAAIEIVGVTGVVTLIEMVLLVAVEPLTHGALLVTTQ